MDEEPDSGLGGLVHNLAHEIVWWWVNVRWCLAGLEGRETEGEVQCALLSLCGERVRGGVLTWEAAR